MSYHSKARSPRLEKNCQRYGRLKADRIRTTIETESEEIQVTNCTGGKGAGPEKDSNQCQRIEPEEEGSQTHGSDQAAEDPVTSHITRSLMLEFREKVGESRTTCLRLNEAEEYCNENVAVKLFGDGQNLDAIRYDGAMGPLNKLLREAMDTVKRAGEIVQSGKVVDGETVEGYRWSRYGYGRKRLEENRTEEQRIQDKSE
ncbi:hypothetical protein BY996DRAFT_8396527 [Phakopsora pachyrhizi]|nr:hypothetical protein BY996DRAFT_8396527 [Phakopsora pachyrhizi]